MKIAIIGCGNMGTGLAEQLSPFHSIALHDRDWEWTQELAKKIKGEAYQDPLKAIENAQFIFLAIKPQNLSELSSILAKQLQADQTVISLLAGTPLSILKHHFPTPHLIRAMPNLALRYGEGVIGLVESPDLSITLKTHLQDLLSPLGLLYWLKEKQIDALTSLTGSGPAFMLTLIEAMVEAGIGMGFQAKEAQMLIIQMLQGCLTLLQESGQHPAELKWSIASPGGTTIAGLRVLEKEKVKSGLIEAFLASYQKAQELAKEQEIKN